MDITDSIIGAESGGNPTARNPNSTASGAGQFLDGTWQDMLARHRPDLAALPPEQQLALKNDPQLSADMTKAYASDNQAILQKNGLPVTPGSTYLAHFAGPGGAVKILQADPNAPVSDILGPAVVKANPFLKDMTAQGLQAWAAKKMGTASPLPQAQPDAPQPNNVGAPLNITPQQPVFAQQPQPSPAMPQGLPQQPSAMPAAPLIQAPQPLQIQFAQRRPIDLSKLQAAFQPPAFARTA